MSEGFAGLHCRELDIVNANKSKISDPYEAWEVSFGKKSVNHNHWTATWVILARSLILPDDRVVC